MGTLRFNFGSLSAEEPVVDARVAYVGVVSDFAIEVGGDVIYSEVMFPVVELAADLRSWLDDKGDSTTPNFEWDSMSTPEPGWVWIRREGSGWRVGSIHQERAAIGVWPSQQIESTIQDFYTRLIARGKEDLKVDLSIWIGA